MPSLPNSFLYISTIVECIRIASVPGNFGRAAAITDALGEYAHTIRIEAACKAHRWKKTLSSLTKSCDPSLLFLSHPFLLLAQSFRE